MSAASQPAGFRPPPPRPAWYVAFGGAAWGYLLALLLTGMSGALLSTAGAPRFFWGVDGPGYVLLGALITAVCLRVMVERISWRIMSRQSLLIVGLLFSPAWLEPSNRFGSALVAIVVVALIVRYRSSPDGRAPTSVGLRLAQGELDKVVSHH